MQLLHAYAAQLLHAYAAVACMGVAWGKYVQGFGITWYASLNEFCVHVLSHMVVIPIDSSLWRTYLPKGLMTVNTTYQLKESFQQM